MLAPQALMRVIISRILPQANADSANVDDSVRGGRYGELYTMPLVRKNHALADEGTYFTANNLQTAITGQTTTAYDATKPSLLLVNTDSVTNPNAKRMYLDYLMLLNGGTAYSNATSNTAMYWGTAMDTGNRYSSGGTQLSINNPNNDVAKAASVALAYAGALATTAAVSLRTIVGQRLLRAPVSATALTLANLDQFFFDFGGVEGHPANVPQASATLEATAVAKTYKGPPHIIGPNQSFLFNINCIAGGAVTAGNFVYEVGWWER